MNNESARQKTGKPTILVVNDNEVGRYTTVRMVRQEGFPVMEAATGGEALEKAGAEPGLIVLDVNLPDISGFEVCRRVKGNPATARIPILHLSATYMDDKARVEGLNGGADGYLTQPVEPTVLLATINALLRIKAAEEKLAEQCGELRRWNQVMLNREDRIMELKQEVNALLVQLGQPARYAGARDEEPEK